MKWLTLLGLLLPALALAQQPAEAPEALVVGVYTPRVAYGGALGRGAFANQIAQQLTAATGVPFRGQGFSSGGAFAEQVAAGKVAFAVVEAQLQARRRFTGLAHASKGGKARAPMALVVGGGSAARDLGGLKGARLATVPVGKGDAGFVANLLLQGEVGAGFFAEGRAARDAGGALSLVKLGKADAAFTFAGATGGLRAVFRSRPVSLPVFVQTSGGLPADVVGKVRAAIRSVRVPGAVIDGFTGYDAGAVEAVARQLGAPRQRKARPVLAPVAIERPAVGAYPAPLAPLPVGFAPAADSLGVPPPPADAF